MSDRESWRNGWPLQGDSIGLHPHCAGCGKSLGLACIALEAGVEYPPEPQWPFEEATCPLCLLRNRLYERDGKPDRLTERMLAMKNRQEG